MRYVYTIRIFAESQFHYDNLIVNIYTGVSNPLQLMNELSSMTMIIQSRTEIYLDDADEDQDSLALSLVNSYFWTYLDGELERE